MAIWKSEKTPPAGYIALCNKGWHFWKGGFVTDKTGLKIFVFINAMIFAFTTFVTNTPLYGKIASKVWKIYFQYISPHFLDAAGSQISDLWLLLLSNSSLFSALMSHLPLLLLHSAMEDVFFWQHCWWYWFLSRGFGLSPCRKQLCQWCRGSLQPRVAIVNWKKGNYKMIWKIFATYVVWK